MNKEMYEDEEEDVTSPTKSNIGYENDWEDFYDE